MSLFIHFCSTYIDQNLEVYSYLYSEGIYRRVCSYIIHMVFIIALYLFASVDFN